MKFWITRKSSSKPSKVNLPNLQHIHDHTPFAQNQTRSRFRFRRYGITNRLSFGPDRIRGLTARPSNTRWTEKWNCRWPPQNRFKVKSIAHLFQTICKTHRNGNFDDDLDRLGECDWIIEVIVERLDIKQQLFERIEAVRKPGTLITSNTSGIPIGQLSAGRSEDFQQHFCGTHFFNPPRYLPLLEIIPGPQTKPEILDFFARYGERILGKQAVLCKDTPAFIANRVGVFAIQALFHTVEEMGLSVEAVDKLTGPAMGRPKSATFRTCDVVGLDTLVHVAKGVADNCPDDERKQVFEIPDMFNTSSIMTNSDRSRGLVFTKKSRMKKGRAKSSCSI